MIKAVSKTPIFRYSLIALLVSSLSFMTFYLYVNYNRSQKLRADAAMLMAIHESSSQIDECIITLYSADNNSRLYGTTRNPQYLERFVKQVKQVDSILNRLSIVDEQPIQSSSEKISRLVSYKTAMTNDYLKLRHQSDVLITLLRSQKANVNYKKKASAINKTPYNQTAVKVPDTIMPVKKKRFFGRVVSLFSKKEQITPDTAVQIVAAVDTPVNVSLPRSSTNYYKRLFKANTEMQRKEYEALLVNSGIIQELISVIKRYKDQEQRYVISKNNELSGNIDYFFAALLKLSFFTVALIILLIITLLYNLWKIFRHEKSVIADGEEARLFAIEKSSFLANMSHEIRTPLNIISGFAEQLEKSELNKNQSTQVGAIRNSADMLLNVVNQVLDLSKYETGKMKFDSSPFSVNKLITDLALSLRMLAEKKGIKLQTEFDQDQETYFCGDSFRLKQVIMNLVGNSIKFTKVGEVVLKVWVSDGETNHQILNVSVRDTGVGISEAELPFIFKEFTQAGTNRKHHLAGTGLGLAISKSIVEQQGGQISVTSKVGEGSIFIFSIPYNTIEVIKENEQPKLNDAELGAALKNKRILLAEDNKMNVILAKTILNKWNMSCDVAYNGLEAYDLFQKNNYDLILTDIHMPEMGGVELTTLVRQKNHKNNSGIPILALTSSVMEDEHEIYLGCGINAIASKPFLEKDLIHKINSLINVVV